MSRSVIRSDDGKTLTVTQTVEIDAKLFDELDEHGKLQVLHNRICIDAFNSLVRCLHTGHFEVYKAVAYSVTGPLMSLSGNTRSDQAALQVLFSMVAAQAAQFRTDMADKTTSVPDPTHPAPGSRN